MYEIDGVGLQADSAVGIAAGSAVFEVSLDDHSRMCQLAAYLVMASCEKVDFDVHGAYEESFGDKKIPVTIR